MGALLGLLSAFALVIAATAIGGTPAAFVNISGILIVILGTIAVTSISFSPRDILAVPRTIWEILFDAQGDPADAAYTVIQLAERARKDGLLELEKVLPGMTDEPFLGKAVALVVDGNKAEDIEQIMNREAGAIASRHIRTVDILRRAGEISPAMGLIGTLIGLVQMLGNLDDPTTIGPAMAVALLTTFYGAILAHMVFIPLATKAERNSSEEVLLNSVYAMGVASIGRRENPRRLEMLINTILPPAKRVRYFE